MIINTINTKNYLSIKNKIKLLKNQKTIDILQFKKIYNKKKEKKNIKIFRKLYCLTHITI
ncbi:hypothetical protein D9V65_00320 [Buchnera aphidicola (Anoecia oenotherae)]|uniref:Uncharacterized protein n=1 Tax=Buchnera aphidicola (Anoecia oenotherae) TaxID=1241833 RepID=A0A4D6XYT5_9GAMM|nr:hypothetical protein D9V65_00320 [Buchnera aphidicola (Anoecia oenotherae)]